MPTFAMRLVGIAYGVIVAVFVLYTTQPFAADFLAVIAGFIALFAVIGLASIFWSGARRRPSFWLVATAPGILVLLFDGFYATYALAHPTDALTFVTTVLVLAAGGCVVLGCLTAWLELRRARPVWQARGRAGFVVAAVAGLVVGACLTSLVAASSANVGTVLTEPPTATASLVARNTRFVDTALLAKSGQVTGIFVTNTDSYGHSFDIDALGIHAPLPAASTTFIAVKPTTTAALEFYCAVPGHKDAGMVGTISVR